MTQRSWCKAQCIRPQKMDLTGSVQPSPDKIRRVCHQNLQVGAKHSVSGCKRWACRAQSNQAQTKSGESVTKILMAQTKHSVSGCKRWACRAQSKRWACWARFGTKHSVSGRERWACRAQSKRWTCQARFSPTKPRQNQESLLSQKSAIDSTSNTLLMAQRSWCKVWCITPQKMGLPG